MPPADPVFFGPRERLIGFDAFERPLALQLGGADPARLAQAAGIGVDFGYDEINLNCGCPSDRVQNGRFGACLMREPALVAECVAAMADAVKIPVTVKCRIGVDEQEPREALFALVEAVRQAGAAAVVVHARKAWLDGLSPKDNRTIPPLDYPLVYALKAAHPNLAIAINGGFDNLVAARAQPAFVGGGILGGRGSIAGGSRRGRRGRAPGSRCCVRPWARSRGRGSQKPCEKSRPLREARP